MDGFFHSVYEIVSRIPPGKVATYGQIAALAGRPRGARMVGWALRSAPDSLPCHRVVNAKGETAPSDVFGGLQRQMLEREGVPFGEDGRIRLRECLWEPSL